MSPAMQPRISLITLAVADLDAAAAFYDALGWPRANTPPELVVYNALGQAFGLFPKAALERETGVRAAIGGMVLSHNVDTPDMVDAVMALAQSAGAQILKPARRSDWGGYHGHFSDLDGHIWEIAHNPFSKLGPDGAFRWEGY